MNSVKMTLFVLFATGLSLSGCDGGVDAITGRNFVVLAPRSVVLAEKAVEFRSTDVMKIAGPLSSVCFALKNGVPLQDMSAMDHIFNDAMGGARISAVIILSSGSRVALSQPLFSWSANGVVTRGHGELAACAAPPCGASLPANSVINGIEVSSAPSLTVNGIYWESKKDPTEPLLPSAKTDAADKLASKPKCPAGRT